MTAMERMIEAGAAIMIGRVNAPEQEIYRAMREALCAALPIVEEELAKAVETKAIRLWGDRFDVDDIISALRARLAEIMEGG